MTTPIKLVPHEFTSNRKWHLTTPAATALPPPARNKSQCSVSLWLALSDKRVVRGECLFAHGRIHDWFLDNDDEGRPHRALSCDGDDLDVVAWAHVEPPPAFPELTPRRKL